MRSKLPYIKVTGSYADVGHAIGLRMGGIIRDVVVKLKLETVGYDNFLQTSKTYFEFTQKIFPQYIIELEAIAAAAGVDKYDYFFHNNREVYDASEKYDFEHAANHEHCTIAVSFNHQSAVVGHNEDWHIDAIDSLYVLKATINSTTFLSLNYAGAIPGISAGINNWGVIQCINDLYQKNQFGVPKNFLARAILESHSLDDAVYLIKQTQRASGFNHVLVQGNRGVNVEIAGDLIATDPITGPYVHTNHYISLKNVEKFHTVSSEARFRRASELVRPGMNSTDMMTLLSDTKDKVNPICRDQETIGSLVFDTSQKFVYICRGHPCSNEYSRYSL